MGEHGAFVGTMIALNLAIRGGSFCSSQITFLNVKVAKTWSIWETHFFPQS